MKQSVLLNFLEQEKKIFHRLVDVSSLTQQLSDAATRKDEISVKMLLSMRQEPLTYLQELESGVRSSVLSLDEEDAIRIDGLLHGAEPADAEEKRLSEQVMMNARLLSSIIALDEQISLKIGGNQSFYRTFR